MYQGPVAYSIPAWIGRTGRVADIGDLVLCNGEYAKVVQIITYEPGFHPDSPIRNDLPARQWVTEAGSRWAGLPCGISGSDGDIQDEVS